jgi:predicted double-glycine peptidase
MFICKYFLIFNWWKGLFFMKKIIYFYFLMLFFSSKASGDSLLLPANRLIKDNWTKKRDSLVVKQTFESSCGAASVATILNFYYGKNVTEENILKEMNNKGKNPVSFLEILKVLPIFDFKGQGYLISYEQLLQLKIPVVVYIQRKGDDHFSVLRGINDHVVWLADSSLGNIKLTKHQFLEVWANKTQDENTIPLKGKVLAILPVNSDIQPRSDFFTKQLTPATDLSIRALRVFKN